MKNLKDKIKNNELTIGSWITIGNPSIAEIMAQSVYDWLTIDMEHSAITLDIAQDLIRIIELYNVTPLVRVGTNDPNIIKRVMDAGAGGVIVPMVNSAQQAEDAVQAVKYPPLGIRGVGLARAQKYGMDFEGYQKWNQESSLVIVQIEHIDAVNNMESILAVDGVDGFIVGPYDLSGSLGVPGYFEHPEMLKALETVKKVSNKKNALSGYHVVDTAFEPFEQKVHEGYKFIAHGIDILFLAHGCKHFFRNVKKSHQDINL